MAVVPMRKVALMGLKEEVDNLGRDLVRSRIMEGAAVKPFLKDEKLASALSWGKENPYQSLESRLVHIMDTLGIELDEIREYWHRGKPIDPQRIEARVSYIERHIQPLVEEREKIHVRKDRMADMKEAVIRMQGLNLPIQRLRQLKLIHRVMTKLERSAFPRILEATEDLPILVVKTWEGGDHIWFMAFYPPLYRRLFGRILKSLGGEALDIPEKFSGTPEYVLGKIRARIAYYDIRIEEIDLRLKELSLLYQGKIKKAFIRVAALNQLYTNREMLAFSENLFFLNGWVPHNRMKELRKELERRYPRVLLTEEEGAHQPLTPPTLMENKPLFKPFEIIVRMYGTPDYHELDPTPLVAISYILMFGAMFGDVGQGLVILLAGLAIRQKGQKDAGAILAMIGLSSSIFGTLYGSLFGFEDIIPALWIRPMEHIQSLLLIAIVFGAVFMLIGMAFNIANGWKERNLERAVFDRNGMIGMAFYLILLLFAYGMISGVSMISVPVFLVLELILLVVLALKAPILASLGQGHEGEGGVETAFELFDAVISFLSNTISFIRIGAFILNHVGLSMAIFLIARMLQHGSSYGAAGWLVIITGNIIILGLEGLIVGIQALRLEFYEFFSKFYRGNGKPFEPMELTKTKR